MCWVVHRIAHPPPDFAFPLRGAIPALRTACIRLTNASSTPIFSYESGEGLTSLATEVVSFLSFLGVESLESNLGRSFHKSSVN